MIIALAGRRIDEPQTDIPRFPAENTSLVKHRLEKVFLEKHAEGVVCAAACGADLIALEVAGNLKLKRRIVLPSSPESFRESSVTDRPGNWGEIFDRIYEILKKSGDVLVMNSNLKGNDLYLEANNEILNEAESLSVNFSGKSNRNALTNESGAKVLTVIVWEGSPRGEDDITKDFADKARLRGFEVVEVLTK